MLHIAVCEDEEIWQKQILTILNRINNKEYDISVFSSGKALLDDYCYAKYDLIFMDIYMKGLNGVDTVTMIRKTDPEVSIAFTTTSPDYALAGYRLNVIKYLEKPIQQKDIWETIHIAKMNKEARELITLDINRKECSFAVNQIMYLEQKNHTIEIHLADGSIRTLTGKLDILEKAFPSPPFFRSHKSFLVNLSQVEHLDKEMLVFVMKDGSCTYIKREKMKEAGMSLDQFLFDELRKDMKQWKN